MNINDTIKQGPDDQSPTELESTSVLEFFDIMMRIEEGTLQTVGWLRVGPYMTKQNRNGFMLRTF
jgi:hypothetical protein